MTVIAIECPARAEAQWTAVQHCPACGSGTSASDAMLPDHHYMFGGESVHLPDAGIAVIECGSCGLVYKSSVPAPAYLAGIFERRAAEKWTGSHDFSAEAAELRRWTGSATFDLLDVGAADGALLKACAESGVRGRRSALDVLRYPGIETHLAGEFIEGFLDAESLTWSREPYEMVTLFDVLEHLYRPEVAFGNLRMLMKRDGLVFIETGNTGSAWPRNFGVSQWWYVRLLEHHIFWSRRSLAGIAAAHGFEMIFWEESRHKSRRNLLQDGMLTGLLKTGLYCLAANQYAAVARLFGKQGNQPWPPFVKDHFRACLRRK